MNERIDGGWVDGRVGVRVDRWMGDTVGSGIGKLR